MRVRCVSNYPHLTVGKVYEVIKIYKDYYYVLNNENYIVGYRKKRFEVLNSTVVKDEEYESLFI